MTVQGLQKRINELEDTIAKLHKQNKILHEQTAEANRRVDIMRKKLNSKGLYV